MNENKNKNINLDNLSQFKNRLIVTLTQAEYNLLSDEEKNSDTLYFISDGNAMITEKSVGNTIIDVVCTYTAPDTETGANGEYTIITDVDLQSEDFFCLRFVTPNDYVKDAVFAIGSEIYTAVNAGFKVNDLVILNFDVSQQKCFFVSGGGEEKDDKSAGRKVEGETFTIDEIDIVAKSGAEIFNNYRNVATGDYSTAMGNITKATGWAAVAMGQSTVAKGYYSFAMGREANANKSNSTAIGYIVTANGQYSTVIGQQTTVDGMAAIAIGSFTSANGDYSTAIGYGLIANKFNFAVGRYNKTPTGCASADSTTGDIFVIGNGRNDSTLRSNAFRVTAEGAVMGTQSYTASGADYAEMFEWTDGNPNNEDRRGLFVTLDGEKIRPASADDDYILGVVSATPSVVADAQTDDWGKKWKTDIFGERLLDENGAWILNENFREEENESYVSRLDRKEWAAVGLVGKLILVDDGTCEVNGYCVPANGGIATKSETGCRVLSRVDENHIKILIK